MQDIENEAEFVGIINSNYPQQETERQELHKRYMRYMTEIINTLKRLARWRLGGREMTDDQAYELHCIRQRHLQVGTQIMKSPILSFEDVARLEDITYELHELWARVRGNE
jgi:hypothetical protein